jgi:hypothetical protein
MSPKMWQLEHEASPLLLVRLASYSIGRPSMTLSGSGLWSATVWTSVSPTVSTTEIELLKRVST